MYRNALKAKWDGACYQHAYLLTIREDEKPIGRAVINKLVKARGRKGADARALAADLHFPLQISEGSLAIPREVPFSEIAKWRDQEVNVEVLVPEGASLNLSERVVDRGNMRVDQYPSGTQLYKMSSSGQLICQTCPAETKESETPAEEQQIQQYQDYNSVILQY